MKARDRDGENEREKRKRKSPSWVIKNKKDSDKTSRRDASHHVTSRRRPTPSPLPLDLSRVSVVGKAEGWKGERGGWEIKIKTNNNRRRFTHCFCFIVKYDDDNNYLLTNRCNFSVLHRMAWK